MNHLFSKIKRFLGSLGKKEGYVCSDCGKIHEDLPALVNNAPEHYDYLSAEEKTTIASLNSDFCTINYPDETDRFIRVTLNIGTDDWHGLEYGLWVSLSEKSFNNYYNNFDNPSHETIYFGWICNNIQGYESTIGIPADVHTRTNGQRQYIVPHSDFQHPLVYDYYNSITSDEAWKRADAVISAAKRRV